MPSYNLSAFQGGVGVQLFDDNGDPLSGGLIYTYTAGTTTPKATYTTGAGSVANANPIVLDAGGRAPNAIYQEVGTDYKFIVKTSAGVTVGTYDNIPSINDPFSLNSILSNVTGTNTIAATGTPTVTAYTTGATYSFIPANDNTGAVTIAIDGLTAKAISKNNGTALTAGDLQAGKLALIEYDGTRFQLLNNIVIEGSVTTATITGGTISGLASPLAVADGGTGRATLTANYALLGNGTTAVQMIAPGTSGNVLTSDGTTWASTAIPSQIPSQTGKSGYVLTTNGTAVSWSTQGTVRAMGEYNSSGTLQTGSVNIASTTNSGTGVYDVVFTSALATANYVVAATLTSYGTGNTTTLAVTSKSTTGFTITTRRGDTGALVNAAANFIVFGGW